MVFRKIIFQNTYVELETSPSFMEKSILNFHFDYLTISLMQWVHKYALDSIVTYICFLLIFSIYRPSSSARSYIASKAWHQIPQAVPVSHDPAYIDPGPDPVPNNYNRLCRHLPSQRLCWNCSFSEWSAMSSYFREFHIFFRGIKFVVIEKCLWRKWALKST